MFQNLDLVRSDIRELLAQDMMSGKMGFRKMGLGKMRFRKMEIPKMGIPKMEISKMGIPKIPKISTPKISFWRRAFCLNFHGSAYENRI